MQLFQLKSIKKKPRKRVGRGGKKGTYSGKGMKGQKSRAGKKPRQGFTGGDTPLIKRFPKKRGAVGKVSIKRGVKLDRTRIKPAVLNLEDINKKFRKGEIVSPESLLNKGLIDRINGRIPRIKILGSGELKKELIFRRIDFSKVVGERIGKSKKVVKKTKPEDKSVKKIKTNEEKIVKTKQVKTKKDK